MHGMCSPTGLVPHLTSAWLCGVTGLVAGVLGAADGGNFSSWVTPFLQGAAALVHVATHQPVSVHLGLLSADTEQVLLVQRRGCAPPVAAAAAVAEEDDSGTGAWPSSGTGQDRHSTPATRSSTTYWLAERTISFTDRGSAVCAAERMPSFTGRRDSFCALPEREPSFTGRGTAPCLPDGRSKSFSVGRSQASFSVGRSQPSLPQLMLPAAVRRYQPQQDTTLGRFASFALGCAMLRTVRIAATGSLLRAAVAIGPAGMCVSDTAGTLHEDAEAAPLDLLELSGSEAVGSVIVLPLLQHGRHGGGAALGALYVTCRTPGVALEGHPALTGIAEMLQVLLLLKDKLPLPQWDDGDSAVRW